MLLRCSCSKERARSNVFGSFFRAIRRAAMPGFCSCLLDVRCKDLDLDLILVGTITGPPSLRLSESQSCGKREE